ncbi:MAG TPA: glycerol-3-phosphate dehydrogenase/oxidase, partial [Spirochaetes bacterium]|nr:glycerol-3-phosphate dehydrogenase/oxidase [Spirochaetota bacterium]
MKRFIEQYRGEEFDIVIIGGGITGAAVAYDAASRGLSVALLEKNDFGWATSSANSKLIHGGLRYLANLEYGLVRESLRERRILGNIAPNMVYPIPFMVPTYHSFKSSKLLLMAGLITYDILAFDKKWSWDKSKRIPNHQAFSRKKALSMEPQVKKKGLTGAMLYYDSQSISPERFTLAFIKSAVNYGARVANYAEVQGFVYGKSRGDMKKITGVRVRDSLKNRTLEVRGKLTINCGGPWADIVLKLAGDEDMEHDIRRSEGIHIITRQLTRKYGVTMMTPKGRHFFIIPWRGHSLIGTTDRDYVGDPDDYHVSRESIEDFIAEINESFGEGDLSYRDVLHAYGGLRPLVDTQTEGTYETSRKYEIYNNALDGYEGLITVEGGKWTTSRNLAINVMNMAQKKLKIHLPASNTHREYLRGCEIDSMVAFFEEIRNENPGFSENTMRTLGMLYGTDYKEVLNIAREKKEYAEKLNNDGEITAQAIYAVRNEMARTLEDILMRRTGIGTLG